MQDTAAAAVARSPSATGAERIAVLLFALLGIAYWLGLFVQPYPGSVVLKPAPMVLAAIVLAAYRRGFAAYALAAGFAASAVGDAFLDIDRVAWLLPALRAFLVAQVAYLLAFARHQPAPWRSRMVWIVPVLAYGVVMMSQLWPVLGALKIPVAIYFIAITAMCIAAIRAEARPGRLLAGALLFVIADSLIAINRFLWPFDASTYVIVAIYTTAQWLIFTGALRWEGLRRR